MIRKADVVGRTITQVLRSIAEETFEASDSSFGVERVYFEVYLELDSCDLVRVVTRKSDPRWAIANRVYRSSLKSLEDVNPIVRGASIRAVDVCLIDETVYFELSNGVIFWVDYDEYGTAVCHEDLQTFRHSRRSLRDDERLGTDKVQEE